MCGSMSLLRSLIDFAVRFDNYKHAALLGLNPFGICRYKSDRIMAGQNHKS
jgi:hypothetical protein